VLLLEDRELALLAHGVGDHLPIELAERVSPCARSVPRWSPASALTARRRFWQTRFPSALPST
jgi:hypothetical protein